MKIINKICFFYFGLSFIGFLALAQNTDLISEWKESTLDHMKERTSKLIDIETEYLELNCGISSEIYGQPLYAINSDIRYTVNYSDYNGKEIKSTATGSIYINTKRNITDINKISMVVSQTFDPRRTPEGYYRANGDNRINRKINSKFSQCQGVGWLLPNNYGITINALECFKSENKSDRITILPTEGRDNFIFKRYLDETVMWEVTASCNNIRF